jgi:hypothetical protein
VSTPGASGGFNAELVKPEIDARIKLWVDVAGEQTVLYTGSVVEAPADDVSDDKEQDWDFVAQVKGEVYDFGTSQYKAAIEFIDDNTASTRARVATESLANGQLARDEGVDIHAVVFRTTSTVAADKQNAGRDLDATRFEKMLQRLKTVWKLNKEQIDAVVETFKSETGLALIYGPPGTGKTTTTTAAALEHCRMGNKVLYTCPSNKATDAALSSFLKDRNTPAPQPSAVRAVRFVGGYKTYQERMKEADPKADVEEWDGLLSATITAAAKSNPDALYHIQKDKAVVRWATSEGHEMKADAKSYCDLLAKVNKHDKRSDKKKLAVLDEKITQFFLEKEVNIVFTTCASACHDVLRQYWKPAAAFLDEAGQATVPDICMALEPFKESIKWLAMSGDYNQLMPVVTAKTSNEGISLLEHSLFRQLVCDPNGRYKHVMLLEQYRQHPQLSAFVNEAYYEGKLRNHKSTEQVTPTAKTIRHFFAQMADGRKNKQSVRFAIDVSDAESFSESYQDTTSFHNPKEAKLIVELISKLLQYRPKVGSNEEKKYGTVLPSDIAIVTSYRGQQRHIRNLLRAYGHESVEVRLLKEGVVSTTWGIQGGEANLVFVSMVAHSEKGPMNKTRFIAQPNALCVQNSRARSFQVTVGNFSGWVRATAAKKGEGISAPYYQKFKALVVDFYTKGDILALEDVRAALLAPPGECKPPQVPGFYAEWPSLDHHQVKKGPKQKGSAYKKDTRGPSKKKAQFQDQGTGDPEYKLGPPKTNAQSERQKKKERQKLEWEARAAQKAQSDALLDEGKGKGKEKAKEPETTTGNWADDMNALEDSTNHMDLN